jgi:ubiquinone/menaquinone biosynthesis C-methylase UbiE
MLKRALEPEVMDTAEEASEYDAMDHAEVNRGFCLDLLALAPEPRRVIDVGTGTARIPIELCRLHATCTVVATDLADHMLSLAKKNVADAGLSDRITVARADAKGMEVDGEFDVVMSNSIVHHIPNPEDIFAELVRLGRGLLFVRDLERPASEEALQELVTTYAAHETERARALFADSLRAALTLDEVVALVAPLGIPSTSVLRTSDRHWTIAHRFS